MLDFLEIRVDHDSPKKGLVTIRPDFNTIKRNDLLTRGKDFYAIWVEEKNMWSTDESDVIRMVDKELDIVREQEMTEHGSKNVFVKYMRNSSSRAIDDWHHYCQKQLHDSYVQLDTSLIFANTKTTREDYSSKKLDYNLEYGSIDAYDKLMSTLYSPEERMKIEWSIGSIISGDSKNIQKFVVLYGSAGTGKSTVLNIIEKLFSGYTSVFDAKSLGSSNDSFALEAFKSNPLVAIQHDGDLSRIEDNTRLNSLVSHEMMTVNEKFKATYSNRFITFLYMGTNKPVKITDAKSGLMRRLIDVSPSGNKIPIKEYRELLKKIDFELGAIAQHCLDVYSNNKEYYDDYTPIAMMDASNDFFNFMQDTYVIFNRQDGTTLKQAWELYKTYCEDAKLSYSMNMRAFKEELKNYFVEYHDRTNGMDGERVRSSYNGFKRSIFGIESINPNEKVVIPSDNFLSNLKVQHSKFDDICSDCFSQYANDEGTPKKRWDDVTTKLKNIDTSRLHYVRVPENHIVIDFDLKDKDGGKSLEKNIEAAKVFPETYAEVSKSGQGLHLHYIYSGDVKKLSNIYSEGIEIKVYSGKSALRRQLTKCNNYDIVTISSGLPLKGDKNVVDFTIVKNEKWLIKKIKQNLAKEIHPSTKSSCDYIYKLLDDAYNSGMVYNVTKMKNSIMSFAANSTNNSEYCLKLFNKMKFKSDTEQENSYSEVDESDLIFFDIEVFPNLFLVNYKKRGKENKVKRLINPTPEDIEKLVSKNLVGFNCRRYDNHILYARMIGKTIEELYDISQKIISGNRNALFGSAYSLSYTDVYDFASAGNKKSLKKFEIELLLKWDKEHPGEKPPFSHEECGLKWDEPVPEDKWVEVAEYCDNDVLATEAVFDYLVEDWTARKILADVAGMHVNDTTNAITTKIIFGNNKTPQEQFNYRFMGDEPNDIVESATITRNNEIFANYGDPEYTHFDSKGRPWFPGYKFDCGKSTYRGEEVGEGGYVYAEPGMYNNVALLDVASMHPTSTIEEVLFGEEYTKRFEELKLARVYIKHGEFDKVKTMLGGKLQKYLTDESMAKNLAKALKTPINSVYGLTAAKFDNPFVDNRNKDNIVAKRGALFMINLKHEVQNRGFTVAHIKTDSIKIPDATPEIIQFVKDYGRMYGYSFEHEATYDRMCLVNDAVYIAKFATVEKCKKLYGEEYVLDKANVEENKECPGEWTATGAQFKVPYVFKTLFSHEPIIFGDYCETKAVTSSMYLDMNEKLGENEHNYKFIGKVGLFCPIKKGCGGGMLLREQINKETGAVSYNSVTGCKDYRWLESDIVKALGKKDCIDIDYFNKLANDAIESISQYGDYNNFVD